MAEKRKVEYDSHFDADKTKNDQNGDEKKKKKNKDKKSHKNFDKKKNKKIKS
jgi:hypothetical protein